MHFHKFSPTVQLTLDRFVSSVRRPRCFIQQLPVEIIADIFLYLPLVSARTRIHRDVLNIPTDHAMVEDVDTGEIDVHHGNVATGDPCIAEQLLRGGCSRFCTGTKAWKCYVILRVCKAWHNIALATPGFWCRIPLHDLNWTTRALQRSKSSFIYAAGGGRVEATAEAISAVLDQLHRVRELYIPLDCYEQLKLSISISEKLCLQPAPHLENLHFKCITFDGSEQSLPGNLFCKISPPFLRTVTLDSCSLIPPTSVIFAPNLTRLTFTYCEDIWYNADDMLCAFSRIPLLEELEIKFGMPFPFILDESQGGPASERLHMPSLRKLNLYSNDTLVTSFLDFFRFHPLTELWITYSYVYRYIDWSQVHLTRAATSFNRHFAYDAAGSLSLSHCQFYVDYDEAVLQLKFCGTLHSPTDTSLVPFLTLHHVNISQARLEEIASSLASTVTALPCNQVTTLKIAQSFNFDDMEFRGPPQPPDADENMWWPCLQYMDNVQHLRIETYATPLIIDWLYLESSTSVHFPLLEDLTLVDFTPSTLIYPSPPWRFTDISSSTSDISSHEAFSDPSSLRSSSPSCSSDCSTPSPSSAPANSSDELVRVSPLDVIEWLSQRRTEASKEPFKIKLVSCDVDDENLAWLESALGHGMVEVVEEYEQGSW